jgi:phage-related protein
MSIKTVLDPVLSKLNRKEQKKEWHNISTLGNIEELRRIASDTAGLVTLYYREQIQCIDSSQKIKGSNVVNDTINSLKHVYDIHPESAEEMAVVMVAEYITAWIIDELKLGKAKIDPTEPLPQQLWLCVARKNPIDQGKMAKLTDSVGLSTGQQKIPLKTKNVLGKEDIVPVQLCYLIGCVSVVGNDGSIYQYSVPQNFSDNDLQDLNIFGYVYVTPFSSDEKALQSIVEGRKLNLAKRDQDGNILTRFEDIIEHAQTYAIHNGQHVSKSLITRETANQVAKVLREQKIFADLNDINEELRKAREIIELSVDVLREEIQDKTKFYQTSIDAAHEQIKRESETNRETMKNDNETLYEEARRKLREKLTTMEQRLEQLIETRMNNIEQYIQQKIEQIVTIVETAQAQSLQAIAETNQATQISQEMLKQATQAAASAQNLVQWTEQQRQEFHLGIKKCETTVKETSAAQMELCERTILEIRTNTEHICERARGAVHESAANVKESAQAVQQSVLNMQDIQRMTKNQLEIQRKEIEKATAETRNARQQTERAIAEAREAERQAKRGADAGTVALNKVNSIHEKVERALARLEQLIKKEESKLPTTFF